MAENLFDKFDTSNISEAQKNILIKFFERRQLIDMFLLEHKINLFTCPGCGYPTLNERGNYEICSVCNWEDDAQDDGEADEIWGGPNSIFHLRKTGY